MEFAGFLILVLGALLLGINASAWMFLPRRACLVIGSALIALGMLVLFFGAR